MREIKEAGEQGDVMFRRVKKVPKGSTEEPPTNGLVVAHSETGHHHTVEGLVRRWTTTDPRVCYLQMETAIADVVHHRPFDTHETLRLLGEPGAIWEVRRQREWSPWGDRTVQD